MPRIRAFLKVSLSAANRCDRAPDRATVARQGPTPSARLQWLSYRKSTSNVPAAPGNEKKKAIACQVLAFLCDFSAAAITRGFASANLSRHPTLPHVRRVLSQS